MKDILDKLVDWNNYLWIMSNLSGGDNASVLQNVILGILTLLIPIGLSLVENYFNDNFKLEFYAVIDKLYLKSFVVFSIYLLFILIFGISWISLILVIVYIIWVIFFPFNNIYKWFTSSNKFKEQATVSFLRKNNNKDLALELYESLWIKNIKFDERKFTKVFIKSIDNILEKEDYTFAVDLCDKYLDNLEKRDALVVANIIFPKLKEWIKYEKKLDGDTDWKKAHIKYGEFYFRHNFLPAIFRLFNKGNGYLFTYVFSSIKKEKDENLLKTFFALFFSFIKEYCFKSDELNIDFLRYFPDEWKIKKDSYKKLQQKIIWREFFGIYANYFLRIDRNIKQDIILNELILTLFPEVDFHLFVKSLSLRLYPNESFIKENVNLSGHSKVHVGTGDDIENEVEKKFEEDISNTVEFMKIIFPDFFNNKIYMNKLKSRFEKIESKGSDESRRKRYALNTIDIYLKTFK